MKSNVAKQIAELLNKENRLVVQYTEEMVLKNSSNYLFKMDIDGNIIACVECKKVSWYQFEFCHLTVNPEYRKKGIATEILKKAEKHAINNNGRIVQCTIREDNIASSTLFSNFMFKKASTFYYPNSGNNVNVWQKVISIKYP